MSDNKRRARRNLERDIYQTIVIMLGTEAIRWWRGKRPDALLLKRFETHDPSGRAAGFVWPCCGQRKTSGGTMASTSQAAAHSKGCSWILRAHSRKWNLSARSKARGDLDLRPPARGWSNPVFFAATTITTATARKRSPSVGKVAEHRRNPKIRKREPVALGAAIIQANGYDYERTPGGICQELPAKS